jgi:putative Mn2+ efflux pump MntP
MNILVIVLLGIGLAMDTFAVAIGTSIALKKVSFRQIFRMAFHFSLFHVIMPLLGWYAGTTIHRWISIWDHWVAFVLLAFIGGKAIYNALHEKNETEKVFDPTRGMSLVILAVATSIDAFGVGMSFAMLNMNILFPALIIASVVAVFTVTGMLLGSKLGNVFGKRVEILGGLILIAIDLKILIEHLMLK